MSELRDKGRFQEMSNVLDLHLGTHLVRKNFAKEFCVAYTKRVVRVADCSCVGDLEEISSYVFSKPTCFVVEVTQGVVVKALRVYFKKNTNSAYIQLVVGCGVYLVKNGVVTKIDKNFIPPNKSGENTSIRLLKRNFKSLKSVKGDFIQLLGYKINGERSDGTLLSLFGLDVKIGTGVCLPFVVVDVDVHKGNLSFLQLYADELGLYTKTVYDKTGHSRFIIVALSEEVYRSYYG